MAGRHRKTSHAKPRRYQSRHGRPQSRYVVMAPVGLAAAVIAGGAIAFTQASGDGGPAANVGGGVVLAVPTPSSSLPPIQAFLTSHSKQKHHSSERRHHGAKQRHHVAPDALLIRDTGPPCYVEVTRHDGRVLVERVIRGHQRLAYRQHDLDVVLGNGGAVRIATNGHRMHRAGRSGQVVRLHVH